MLPYVYIYIAYMDPMGNEAVLSWAMLGLMVSVGSAILIPLIGQDSKQAATAEGI